MKYKQNIHLSYVYSITNLINGKKYIGVTQNYKVRWGAHLDALRARRHSNIELQKDFNLYGESSFLFSLLERIRSVPNDGVDKEWNWICKEKTYWEDRGYNSKDIRYIKHCNEELNIPDYSLKLYTLNKPEYIKSLICNKGYSNDYISGCCGLEQGDFEKVLEGTKEVTLSQAKKILVFAGLKPKMVKTTFYLSGYKEG